MDVCPELQEFQGVEKMPVQQSSDNLFFSEAARIAGRDVKWVHRQIELGRLKTLWRVDRIYVSRKSLARLLARKAPR
jgi:hypothetical protein